ncbi:MAG: EAL domain-containing protein [Thermoanaerobaculia bacterium]
MNLRQRILALVLVLLLLVLGVTLAIVSRVTYRHTLERSSEELVASQRMLVDSLWTRDGSLREAAGTLAKDDALRQAIFAGGEAEPESMQLALDNHRRRTNADSALLVDLDGVILVDTGDSARETLRGKPFPFPDLLVADATAVEASPTPNGTFSPRLVTLRGRIVQLVCVPYYVPVSAPRPSLWLILGRNLDESWARAIRELVGVDVSLLGANAGGGQSLFASSLPIAVRAALTAESTAHDLPSGSPQVRELAGEEYLSLSVPLGDSVAAVLDRPTAAALLDYRKLVGSFAWIALLAAVLALAGAWELAHSVTRPIRSLEQAARRIAAGDYAAALPIDEAGEVGGLAREFDAMQRSVRAREAAIQHLAFHDELTGLPNRNEFRADLARRISVATREHAQLAVALIDVDRFQDINDALGHHVGDHLLLALAQRLREVALRRGLLVARLGGDEFAVVFPAPGLPETRAVIAEIETALGGSTEIEEVRIDVSASVGVALFPEHGGDPATLLRRAEVAMYAAKKRHTGTAFYDPAQDPHSVERLSLAGDLRRAIANDELRLAFQPKIDLASDEVGEVEVLLRWTHPRLGQVPPAEFIALAERTGAIREITGWVLDHAIAQASAWRREGLDLVIAVNLSALDLLHAEFAERLRGRLAAAEFPADRLILELTESSVMEDPQTALRLLDEVTAMGVRISVDDFGTGYSSLAQLQRLPVREIKVDRSFVLEMTRSNEVAQIVRSTIELGHNLGLRVVGEGVENEQTLAALRDIGCDFAQGYFVSPPLSAPDLRRWLESRGGVVAGASEAAS